MKPRHCHRAVQEPEKAAGGTGKNDNSGQPVLSKYWNSISKNIAKLGNDVYDLCVPSRE